MAGLDGETVADFIKRYHKKMRSRRCTRCYGKGHERASCWYLQSMGLEVRRSGNAKDKQRYAVVRAWMARKGANAARWKRDALKEAAMKAMPAATDKSINKDFLCLVGKDKFGADPKAHKPVVGGIAE